MTKQIIILHDILEANGKTIKENNLEKKHNIPLGALVEVEIKLYTYDGNGMEVDLRGKCKVYVVDHGRDCDGTPLYSLSSKPVVIPEGISDRIKYGAIVKWYDHGYPEERLKVVSTGSVLTTWEEYLWRLR